MRYTEQLNSQKDHSKKFRSFFMFCVGNEYYLEINNLLATPNASVESMLRIKSLRGALRKGNPKLFQFLLFRIVEIVDIAFGVSPSCDYEIQSNALYILKNSIPSFTSQLTTNRTYLLKLMSFIELNEPCNDLLLATFCSIFEFIVSSSSGFIFIHLPEKDMFISRLISHLIHNSVYNFLIFLSLSPNQVVIDYLTNSQAVLILMKSIGSDSIINERIFHILAKIVKNPKTSLLPNQLISGPFFEKSLIYSIDNCCTRGFECLINIHNFYPQKGCSTPFSNIVLSKSDKIRLLIEERADSFLMYKGYALKLLIYAINTQKIINNEITKLSKFLLDLFFQEPAHNKLHEAFYYLFNEIIRIDPNIVINLNIREKIAETYSNPPEIATFWGHLHEISRLILNARNELKHIPEFEQYVEDHYTLIENILTEDYGGDVPRLLNNNTFKIKDSYSSSSSSDGDDDFCENDDEKEIDNLQKWHQVEYESNQEINAKVSLNLQANLFVTDAPKTIIFGQGGLVIGIASEKSLEIFKLPDFSRVKTRKFDTSLLSFSFTRDESQFYCCFYNKITLFNLSDSNIVQAYCFEKANNVVMHDSSTRFCTFHDNGTIRIRQLPKNVEIATFQVEKGETISSVTFSKCGKYIIIGYESGLITLFDIDEQSPPFNFQGSNQRINSVFFDPIKNQLFTACNENALNRWGKENNIINILSSYNHKSNVLSIDVKDKWLVSGSYDHTFTMVNIQEDQMCYYIKAHLAPVICVAFASYREIFATASDDKTVKIWTYQNLRM
ncbi:hypothetical protein TRFO_00849 [Tritrichomonas foetus]|uniref:Uncharacterized protein n=1 Tax=Tritrichomonas foetus TaxID=1144522 RepID=A0A1J4L255_9EUKA|nr:hypothetical protein TRFO_00849 [Tritrichomonas foetus]|eukprot:OHT17593.1 hypothetical protein TRFO_00849 [Tritrichomonas foetus]